MTVTLRRPLPELLPEILLPDLLLGFLHPLLESLTELPPRVSPPTPPPIPARDPLGYSPLRPTTPEWGQMGSGRRDPCDISEPGIKILDAFREEGT